MNARRCSGSSRATPPVELSAPDLDPNWRTTERSGETLWPAPVAARPKRTGLQVTIDPDEGTSFV